MNPHAPIIEKNKGGNLDHAAYRKRSAKMSSSAFVEKEMKRM
jgi:hypothetical protein